MNCHTDLCTEFDKQRGALFVSAEKRLRIATEPDLVNLAEAIDCLMEKHFSKERGFLLVNLQQIAIEPNHLDLYVARIRQLYRLYLRPHGLIAYGFEITRVTAQLSHEMYDRQEPNLFNTREEAEAFVDMLIAGGDSDDVASIENVATPAETLTGP